MDVGTQEVHGHDAQEVIDHANDGQERKNGSRIEPARVGAGHRRGLRGSLSSTPTVIVPSDEPRRILRCPTVLCELLWRAQGGGYWYRWGTKGRPKGNQKEMPEAELDLRLHRLLFLADGIYAIAATLLAVELVLPEAAADLHGREL